MRKSTAKSNSETIKLTPAMRKEFQRRAGIAPDRIPATRIYKRLAELAKKRGISITRHRTRKTFPGLIIGLEDGRYGISICGVMPMAFQAFVLAHELGHYCLHRKTGFDSMDFRAGESPSGWKARFDKAENEADRFAGRLLKLLARSLNVNGSVHGRGVRPGTLGRAGS